jgi:alpha-tubulin suppressor-like RCC1 family protein
MDINKIFYKHLKEYFKEDFEICLKTYNKLFIITKKETFFEINCKRENIRSFAENAFPVIEPEIKSNLCYKKIIKLAYGSEHWVALSHEGKIYSWGDNECGQLGDGNGNCCKEPEFNVFLENEKIVDIKCGSYHSLVLTEKGEVYSWGLNNYGQLGIGIDEEFTNEPSKINLDYIVRFVDFSCGKFHSLALTDEGLVYAWGNNTFGQLGLGKFSKKTNKPVQILLSDKIKQISCGENHSILLSFDGCIYCFGSNFCGEIGNGSRKHQNFPKKLTIDCKFSNIASDFQHSISIGQTDNKIYYIWGHCGNEVLLKPEQTKYKSLNDIFDFCFGIHYDFSYELNSFENPLFRNEFYTREFDQIEFIDMGSYGQVYKASKKKNGRLYAIKKIELNKNNLEVLKEFSNYLCIFKLSHFANIYLIKYFDAWFEESFTLEGLSFDSFYIHMELCDNTIEELILQINDDEHFKQNTRDGTLTISGYFCASQIFIEILEGVNFLHKQVPPIIHRDLNTGNILLRRSNGSDHFVKISDFGIIALHDFSKIHTLERGTLKFMAPEVGKNRKYNTKADIFSIGHVFQELIGIDVIM